MTAPPVKQRVDLVLSGGGVKGIGLVGAVVALMDGGYPARRICGTSAGSIIAAIAAAGGDQLTGEEIKKRAFSLPYPKFLDPGPLKRIPFLGPAWAVATGTGIYKGDFAHCWIRDQLKDFNVTTFGDLRLPDKDLPPNQRYRLVVTVTDVTTGQLIRLPWDYQRVYNIEPDEQPVADAVRASMSIPYIYRPVSLTNKKGITSTLVDGGMLSNFPIDTFNRTDGQNPRWPPFGVTVLPNLPEGNDKVIPGLAWLHRLVPQSLHERLITTLIVGRDQAYLNQPLVKDHAIYVDSTDVGFLDFGIKKEQMEALYKKGYDAGKEFLSRWDWSEYCRRRGFEPPSEP